MKSRAGLTGRGGVGNWSDSAAQTQEALQEERRKAQDLDAKVLQEVEAGLAMPARVYNQHRSGARRMKTIGARGQERGAEASRDQQGGSTRRTVNMYMIPSMLRL